MKRVDHTIVIHFKLKITFHFNQLKARFDKLIQSLLPCLLIMQDFRVLLTLLVKIIIQCYTCKLLVKLPGFYQFSKYAFQ